MSKINKAKNAAGSGVSQEEKAVDQQTTTPQPQLEVMVKGEKVGIDPSNILGSVVIERKAGETHVEALIPNTDKKIKVAVPKMDTDTKHLIVPLKGEGFEGKYIKVTLKRIKGDSQGRPVDMNSVRQQKLAEQEIRRKQLMAAGIEVKQGRPKDPSSVRQQQLQERGQKLVERATEHPDYKKLIAEGYNETDAITKVITDNKLMSRGRPTDPTSTRQEHLKVMDAKRQLGELKRGRPASNILLETEEVVVMDAVESGDAAE